MSSRTIRKLYRTTDLPPLQGTSDEEFAPLYTRNSNPTFSGLAVSSRSESDQEVPESVDNNVSQGRKKKKKNNKKNQRKAKLANLSRTRSFEEMDEIDKSVKEVNALLGSPPPASAIMQVIKKKDPLKVLFSVKAKHLDYNNELKRIFGSESIDDTRGKKCRPHNVIKYRRGAIVPIPENRQWQYVSVGLSMTAIKRKDDPLTYFTFDHNREYQKMHQLFLKMSHEDVLPSNDNGKNAYIEGLLKSADYMFRAEEYTSANSLLELIISYMHYVAHPCFNLTDQSIRLEYKYMENRPFHIAVLKFCHMLTNKALHRTALELAKLLLNLDPSDPLAIIFIIDTIALRAREHQWLIDAIDYWKVERDAEYLFNLQYSYAMAHFHVARKSKTPDFVIADELVKEAMLSYPTIANRLLENSNQDCGNLCSHPFFNLAQEDKYPDKIKTAMILHTKLVYWRWREPKVMQWFAKNAKELINKFDIDPGLKKRGEDLSLQCRQLYEACPDEIHRHLHVVRPMANLLAEWELPLMSRQVSWDPLPPTDGINRYNYPMASEVDPRYYNNGIFNIFARFIDPGQMNPERIFRRRVGPVAAPRRPRGGDQQIPAPRNNPRGNNTQLHAADTTPQNTNSETNYPEGTTHENNTLEGNTNKGKTLMYTVVSLEGKIKNSNNAGESNADKSNADECKIHVNMAHEKCEKETQTINSFDEDCYNGSGVDCYHEVEKTTHSDNPEIFNIETAENGDPGNQNAESNNFLGENAEIDHAVNYNAVSDDAVKDNVVSDNAVNDNVESDNAVNDTVESDNAVNDKVESDNAVNENTDSNNAENDITENNNTGNDNTESDNAENVNTESNNAANDNTESDNTENDTTDNDDAVIDNAVNDNVENINTERDNAVNDNVEESDYPESRSYESESEAVRVARIANMRISFNRLFLRAVNLQPCDQLDPEKWDFYCPDQVTE